MLTLLVVEDFADTRDMLAEWLLTRGYNVIQAENGWQAVGIALTQRPDLILMDLNLPVLDGIEAACLLRENEKLKHIPIVAITAHDTPDSRLDVSDIGFDDYVTKPIDFERLEHIITHLLRALSL